jgi:hypothetical protein
MYTYSLHVEPLQNFIRIEIDLCDKLSLWKFSMKHGTPSIEVFWREGALVLVYFLAVVVFLTVLKSVVAPHTFLR